MIKLLLLSITKINKTLEILKRYIENHTVNTVKFGNLIIPVICS